MASAIIHIAVAKILSEELTIEDKKDYYLGSIAPDLSKQINETKTKSHFLYDTKSDIPNIKMFTDKYPNFKNNSFDLGYFIHLYTDKLWFDDFLDKIIQGNSIKLLDGTVLSTTPEEMQKLLYQDYTNLNIQVIDEYNLDLSLFYEEFHIPNTTIDEIAINKLNILIDKMGVIIENSKVEKNYTFDIILIKEFIKDTVDKIREELKKY